MPTDSATVLAQLIGTYGIPVFLIVMLESAGIPLPGETALVTAAIYAGTTNQLDIAWLIAAAATAAVVGDNLGYWAGRKFGLRLLLKYGAFIHLDERRLKVGQYLFLRHGGKIVFFGRFVAFLRVFAAVLAGVNKYPWPHFLMFNALGGIVWANVFGLGAYYLGESIQRFTGPVGIGLLAGAVIGIFVIHRYFKQHETALIAEAERAIPGPLAAV